VPSAAVRRLLICDVNPAGTCLDTLAPELLPSHLEFAVDVPRTLDADFVVLVLGILVAAAIRLPLLLSVLTVG